MLYVLWGHVKICKIHVKIDIKTLLFVKRQIACDTMYGDTTIMRKYIYF